ncbi:hypothetical protein [Paracoccus halophilus]|nr:hypothetical protein [Paracoccus halophilus]
MDFAGWHPDDFTLDAGSAWIVVKISHANFLTLARPCLAYAGIV